MMMSYYRTTVMGQVLTVRTNRKYAVVIVRPEPVLVEQGVLVAFARADMTTDSLSLANKKAGKLANSGVLGCKTLVIDLAKI